MGSRRHTLWTLAAQFRHRTYRFRRCVCGRLTSGHEFFINGLWRCRRCADNEHERRISAKAQQD